jgi:hypothetical protein
MPSVGESQDRGAGVDRLVSKGRGDGIGGLWRKGDNIWNVNEEKNLIKNFKKLETTQMFINQRMDTENVVYLQNAILLSY